MYHVLHMYLIMEKMLTVYVYPDQRPVFALAFVTPVINNNYQLHLLLG